MNARREAFCREYLVDHNGAAAARRAGYSAKSAESEASRLLRDPGIKAFVAKLEADQVQRLQMEADDVLREVALIARFDPKDLFDEDGGLLPVHRLPVAARRAVAGVRYDSEGRPILKFWNKQRALEALGRRLHLFDEKPQRQALSVRFNISGVQKARKRSSGSTNDEQ